MNDVEEQAPPYAVVLEETIERLRFISSEEAAQVLSDDWFWDQEGPGFSCREAEALGALLVAHGIDIKIVADLIVTGHGQPDRSEDYGDDHWHAGEEARRGGSMNRVTTWEQVDDTWLGVYVIVRWEDGGMPLADGLPCGMPHERRGKIVGPPKVLYESDIDGFTTGFPSHALVQEVP